MQQIYKKKTHAEVRFQVAKQLYWNHTSAWVLSCIFAAYFQNTFYYEHLWMIASEVARSHKNHLQ